MTKIPKKNGLNWNVFFTVAFGLVVLMILFYDTLGAVDGGRAFANWGIRALIVWMIYAAMKDLARKKVRTKVKYENGDNDVFVDAWADLLYVLIMGIVTNMINVIIEINGVSEEISSIKLLITPIAVAIPFYLIYKAVHEPYEIEMYKKCEEDNREENKKEE